MELSTEHGLHAAVILLLAKALRDVVRELRERRANGNGRGQLDAERWERLWSELGRVRESLHGLRNDLHKDLGTLALRLVERGGTPHDTG